MKRLVAAAAVVVVCVTLSSGCAGIADLMDRAGIKAGVPSKPPAPTPVLSAAEAKRVVAGWADDFNRAARRYDIEALSRITTGALLEERETEFKIMRYNDVRVPLMRGASNLAIPRLTDWPKWFTAAVAVKAKTRELHRIVFVQRTRGGPWRAASDAVVDQELIETMGRFVQAPADAKVVPTGDTSLAIAPNRLAAAHAHAFRYGSRSPHARFFGGSARVDGESEELLKNHRFFKRNGWSGRTTVRPAPHPMYVLRTPSNGAVAIYALDHRSTYRRVKGDIGFSSKHPELGQMFPALIGSTYAYNEFTRVMRIEFATYIPQRNTSKIQILASRWTVVSAEGA